MDETDGGVAEGDPLQRYGRYVVRFRADPVRATKWHSSSGRRARFGPGTVRSTPISIFRGPHAAPIKSTSPPTPVWGLAYRRDRVDPRRGIVRARWRTRRACDATNPGDTDALDAPGGALPGRLRGTGRCGGACPDRLGDAIQLRTGYHARSTHPASCTGHNTGASHADDRPPSPTPKPDDGMPVPNLVTLAHAPTAAPAIGAALQYRRLQYAD